jgi:fatty-acyl-CoA synthase
MGVWQYGDLHGELAALPGIKMGKTVGVPHDTLGEMVVSCVVAQEGAALTEDAIRTFLKSKLASYKVPRRVLFVREHELSLTGSAKIKLSALRELILIHLNGSEPEPENIPRP